MTKEQRQFSGERLVFPANGTGTIGHLHAKNQIYTPTLHLSQKLIQNSPKPKYKAKPEDNLGENLYDVRFGEEYADKTQKVRSRKEEFS